MALVTVNFPPGLGTIQPRTAQGGSAQVPPVVPDANGQAQVDTTRVLLADLLAHGCSVAPASGTHRPAAEAPDRPSRPWIGCPHFDQGLGKPVWWNGSAWVDATGTAE